jgi:hypothetical protein
MCSMTFVIGSFVHIKLPVVISRNTRAFPNSDELSVLFCILSLTADRRTSRKQPDVNKQGVFGGILMQLRRTSHACVREAV